MSLFHILFVLAGVNCEIDIDECEFQPCQNGATCLDGINEFTCDCKPGFEGERCQIEINECEKYDPCENDALCNGKYLYFIKFHLGT